MPTQKQTVLLTGGAGVLGRALIDELATDFDVICVRHRTPIGDPRVTEVAGNLSEENLGVDSATLARVDLILHSAATTSWRATREQIFATNLGGTTRMLDLAGRLQAPLYYMSTAFVVHGEQGTDSRFGGATSYIESKIAAEQLVRDSGLDAAILRPSVVYGHSDDGRMSAFQGFSHAAGAIVEGTAPVIPADPHSMIDALPQDLVAQATAHLLRRRVTSGEYWLTAGEEALVLRDIVDTCVAFSARLELNAHRPRLIPVEAVDRLLLPLLEDALPPVLRRRLRDFAELLLLFQLPAAIPSSMAELGFAEEIRRPALAAAFERSLEYWARKNGLLPELQTAEVAA